MSPQEFDAILSRTLADRRLTGSERAGFAQTLAGAHLADAPLAAPRRGVRLRVITDNAKAHDLGSDIGRFQDAGVAVREDRTPFHMHHKYALFDAKWLLNGSYNWTRGAARDNQENCVV